MNLHKAGMYPINTSRDLSLLLMDPNENPPSSGDGRGVGYHPKSAKGRENLVRDKLS